MKKLLILGTGAYASALASALTENFKNIVMYGIDEEEINDINLNRKNEKYFEGKIFPKNIKAVNSFESNLDVDAILIAVPSKAISSVLKELTSQLKRSVYWIGASKGLIDSEPIHEDYLYSLIPTNLTKGIYRIIGGTFAIEIVQKKPSKLTLTSKNDPFNEELYESLSTPNLLIEWSEQFELINYFAIFKNIFAIFQGILSGMDYEKNTQTFLLVESLRETMHIFNDFGRAKNFQTDDLFLSATLGDFILTGTSEKSRNYSFGKKLGQGKDIEKIKYQTVEGLDSFKRVNELIHNLNEYCILKYLKNVLIDHKDAKDEFRNLLEDLNR